MKKTKLLMPVLAIAGLGATIAPMVTLTSCNKDKGYGGIEITSAELDDLKAFYDNDTHETTNYSISSTAINKQPKSTITADTTSKIAGGLEYEEQKISFTEGPTETTKTTYKWNTSDNKMQKWNSEDQQYEDLGADEYYPTQQTAELVEQICTLYKSKDLTYTNGAYKFHSTTTETGIKDLIVVIKKIGGVNRITYVELTSLYSTQITVTCKINFFNYGNTEVAEPDPK